MERVTSSGLAVIEHRAAFNDPLVPNGNDPADNPPATVGPPTAVPGDPNGFELIDEGTGRPFGAGPPRAAPWSGWPAEWATPNWWGRVQLLTDTAWMCLDKNASSLSTFPRYLVGAAPSLGRDWLTNPDPDQYTGWPEFAKQLFWDYQCAGEAFVLATSYYATGYPARFHVVPPWLVEADVDGDGLRSYSIGSVDVTGDMLHVRYTSRVGDAHGHGPLEIAAPRLVAAAALARYAQQVAASGGIPNSVLTHPARLTAKQAAALQAQWVEARIAGMGMPAVLSGGVEFKTLTINPRDMALVELSQWNESRIALLLGVPPFIAGLPSGGDSMTYSNVNNVFVYRWRESLNPMVVAVMEALSNWLLPRGTTLELNRDEYLRPSELERAQASETWVRMGALTAQEVRERERFGVAAPSETLTSGVLQ